MSDNMKFTARVTAEAAQHAMNVLLTERRLDKIAKEFTPVCGKPGQGFKAMRKLRKTRGNELTLARQAHDEALIAKDAWANQNGKASHATREKRAALYIQLLGNLIALDTLETAINSGRVKTFDDAVDAIQPSRQRMRELAAG